MSSGLGSAESHHRFLFETNPHPMWICDVESLRFVAVNDAALRTYGYGREAFLGLTIEAIVRDVGGFAAGFRGRQGQPVYVGESRHVKADGSLIDVEIHSHRMEWEGRPARFVVAFDVTERKRSAAKIEGFFALSTDLLCVTSDGGVFQKVNPQWQATFGYAMEEMVGHSFVEFVHPDDLEATAEAWRRMSGEADLVDFVNRYKCGDGSYRTLEWRAHSRGGVIYAVARDVTARRAAESRLRDLTRAVEHSPAVVVITDDQGRIEYVNPKFEQLTGYTAAEVHGQTPRILKSGLTPEEQYRQMWETIAMGNEWVGEFQNRKKDGSLYLERALISPVRDEAGVIRHFVAVKEDITATRALEKQLLQAQKMEAVGLLAGGIAHDFNNLLTIINGYGEVLERNRNLSEEARQFAAKIRKAGGEAAALTQQLLAFSRRQVVEPETLNLETVLDDLGQFYRRVLPENITLQIEHRAPAAVVRMDPNQIQQLIMNLVINARDAMPGGGLLRIVTAEADIAAGQVRNMAPGRYVTLAVEDTGEGMSSEVQEHLYEPFFTTKPANRGTGLGLSIVYGVVNACGGSIQCESEVGKGTTFTIHLPDASDRLPAEPGLKGRHAIHHGEEKILLVEDNPEVREFILDVLTNQGFHVIAAASAEAALEIAEEQQGRFDLLLTDVMLPGLSGPELVQQLKRTYPKIGVLYASGYAGNTMEEKYRLPHGAKLVQKPFTVDTLIEQVSEVVRQMNAGTRILVVDDDVRICELMEGMLTNAGFEVWTAHEGGEALEFLEATPVDLVITDLVMPGVEGMETMRELRRRHPHVLMIAMSGAFGGEFLETAKLLGARATLLKPVGRGQLLSTVRGVLRG